VHCWRYTWLKKPAGLDDTDATSSVRYLSVLSILPLLHQRSMQALRYSGRSRQKTHRMCDWLQTMGINPGFHICMSSSLSRLPAKTQIDCAHVCCLPAICSPGNRALHAISATNSSKKQMKRQTGVIQAPPCSNRLAIYALHKPILRRRTDQTVE